MGLVTITSCGGPGPTPVAPSLPLDVGSATAAPGEEVTLAVTLDSLGTTVLLAQVNLTFQGLTLTSPIGSAGTGLPPTWLFIPFSPAPGSLNFLAVDLAGIGQALGPSGGPIFSATFTVDVDAIVEAVPVIVDFADVRDGGNFPLNLAVTPGSVTITGP